MNTANDLSRMVPGLDFLQNLLKGAAIPGVQGFGQWVAPTLDPEEIEKRISELKTVQFWLEQNARLLGATIQALEVQRMTLATLQTMNLPMADLRDALKARPPAAAAAAPARPPAPVPVPVPAPPPAPETQAEAAGAAPPPPAVDPMQWWGALTQQFTELATQALKDGSAAAATVAASAKPAPLSADKPAARPAANAAAAKKAAGRTAPRRKSGA